MNILKILVVGDFEFKIYEEALYQSFKNLGHESAKFEFVNYFKDSSCYFLNLKKRIEKKLVLGKNIRKLNFDFIKFSEEFKPDIIFIYRGRYLFPSSYESLKKSLPNMKLYLYNNDDPFSNKYPKYFWRNVIDSSFLFDHIFCYRNKNINDYQNIGIHNLSLLKSYFIKGDNYLFNNEFLSRGIDVVFIGHFENDNRDEVLKYLIQNGITLKLYGTDWKKSKYYSYFLDVLGPIKRLNKTEYNDILNNSKLAIVFLSKRNNDNYTRRCFEIPAAGCVMVSEYTDEIEEMFEANKEILFFHSEVDLLSTIQKSLLELDTLKEISKNAYRRLMADKHEVQDRANEIINQYYKYRV